MDAHYCCCCADCQMLLLHWLLVLPKESQHHGGRCSTRPGRHHYVRLPVRGEKVAVMMHTIAASECRSCWCLCWCWCSQSGVVGVVLAGNLSGMCRKPSSNTEPEQRSSVHHGHMLFAIKIIHEPPCGLFLPTNRDKPHEPLHSITARLLVVAAGRQAGRPKVRV